MSSKRRLARNLRRMGEPDITVVDKSSFAGKPKPILLTEPTMRDLAPYGSEMRKALELGYQQGLESPCVLVVWRGSAYAKEQGLAGADEPLTFRPIAGAELSRLSGLPAYMSGPAVDMLPMYLFGLTRREDIEIDYATDMAPEGAELAWRYSRCFRRTYGPSLGAAGMEALERLTGVGRDA
jgi:hypothetical protein